MNKGAIVIVIVALGLGGYMLMRPGDTDHAPKPVTVKGYLADAAQAEWRDRKENPLRYLSEKEEDRKKKFTDPPYDEVVVTRDGSTIRLKKTDDKWELVEPTTSPVEKFRIQAMLEIFATDTALNPARTVKNKDHLSDFGLDSTRAIHVAMLTGGTPAVELIIGDRKKVSEDDENGGQARYDTFVMVPSSDSEVYRAKLKDLRKPFEAELGDLRSKKVFPFDLTAISRVTIENPADTAHPKLVLSATWKEKAKAETPDPEKPEGDDKPEMEGAWTLDEPKLANFELTNLRSYWSAIAGLRANSFIMEKPGSDTGLMADGVARVTIELKGSEVKEGAPTQYVLRFGEVKEKDKSWYAMIEGTSEHMVVSQYTRDNILKSLGDLRDKNVLGIKNDDEVTRIELTNAKTGPTPLVLVRNGEQWTVEGTGARVDDKEAKGLVSGLRYLRATEFLADAPKEGLETPSHTVKATIGGVVKTLVLGAERDSKVLAHLAGTDLYFQVGTFSRDKFDKGQKDLQNKTLIEVQLADIQKVELVHTDETVVLEPVPGQEANWQMTAPESITGASGLDENLVKALANNFKAFAVKGFTDKTLEAAGLVTPAFRARITLKDGSTREILVSNTLDGEDHYVSVVGPGLDATTVYTLDKYKVQNLRKKAADLKKDS